MNLKNKKYLLYIAIYMLPIILFAVVLKLTDEINFVPLVNNAVLIFSFFLMFISQIFTIIKFIESEFQKYLRVIGAIILIAVAIFGLWISFVISIFAYCDSSNLNYESGRYYIVTEGFPDIYHDIYEKNSLITMRKLKDTEIINIFKRPEMIEDEEAREIIEGIIAKNNAENESYIEDKGSSNVDIDKKFKNRKAKDEILSDFDTSDVNRIQNSNYGVLEVDSAMARSLWYFVEIKGERIIFVSEVPDTSPSVSGEVTESCEIHLTFTDINENVNKYKSNDGGHNWTKYYSSESIK